MSIRRAHDRAPNGAGVLVTDRHVLTCAHVTVPNNRRQPPEGPLFVHFHHADPHEPIPAVVVEGGWHPQDSVLRTGDLAVLELQTPLPGTAATAPLVSTENGVWGHRFHVYGYPEGDHRAGGVSANGTISGRAGPDWIQLESTSTLGHGLAPGFSGSPVWDITLGGVIGIVAARDKPGEKHDPRTGYAIPVEALAGFWPPLRELIRKPVAEEQRAEVENLLALPLRPDGELPRIRDVRIYDIGVTPSKNLAHDPDPPYVPRQIEDGLLKSALDTQPFILLAGESKAGKSRTLIELLRHACPDARLIVPKDTPSAPGDLGKLSLPTGGDRAVLWLDDIHEYLRPGGVDLKVLEAFARHQPAVTVVATITSEAYSRLKAPKGEVNRAARQVLGKVKPIILPRLLRDEDRAEAQRLYEQEDFTDRGIGEQMIAAPLLEDRLNGGREECPEGWAVVRAAVDWQRMGCEAPLTKTALRQLFVHYLAAGPSHRAATDAAFDTSLDWATRNVAGSIALLSEYLGGGDDGENHYEAFAYLPAYVDARGDPETTLVPRFAWDYAVQYVPPDDLLGIAFAAFTREEPDIAVSALERAHDSAARREVVAWAALILGEVAMRNEDLERARTLLEQAHASQSPDVVPLAQVDLAALFQLVGETEDAQHMLELALASRDPQAAPLAQASLGGLLLAQGELDRARELLESAVNSGDPQIVPLAAANLGGLIVQRGEMSTARAPSQDKREPSGPHTAPTSPGHPGSAGGGPLSLPRAVRESAISQAVPLAQANLAALLIDTGDLERAGDLLHAAISSANPLVVPLAQASLGGLFIQQGDFDQGRELLESAVRSDNLFAAQHAEVTLGWLLCLQGEPEQAGEHLERALGFSNPEAVLRARCLLGTVRATEGDLEGAVEALQMVVDSGHPGWAVAARADQAMYWAQAGEYEQARAAFAEIAGSNHPEQGPRAADLLGDVLAAQEDWAGAETAYRGVINSGHPVWASIARMDLAVMLTRIGDERGLVMLTRIADSGETDQGPRAGDLLGDALAARGDWTGAEAAYRKAIDSGHEHWAAVARVDLALMLADIDEIPRSAALLAEEAETGSSLADIAAGFLGILRIHQGHADEGRELLERAAASESAEAVDLAGIQLAKLAADAGRLDEAAARFQALLSSDSGVAAEMAPLARAHLGALRLRRGEVDAALELLDEAAASDRPDAAAIALMGRGEYLLDAGDSAVAQQYLHAALDMDDPEVSPKALALIGVALLAENDLEGAREALTEALACEVAAIEPLVRRYLGSALAQLDRWPEAQEVLLPLARSDDREHRPQGLVVLGQLAVLGGRPDEAREYFEEAAASVDMDARAQALLAMEDSGHAVGHRPPARALPPSSSPWDEPAPEFAATTSGKADRMTDAPVAAPAAAPALGAKGTAVLPRLPLALLVLLGRAAEGEGLPGEARYWFDKAIAGDQDADDTVLRRARTLLAELPTEQARDAIAGSDD
ncbi:tetratricopeptide repeat protein [Streptomyces sp. NBC_01142]|uniref:tetratricopeptide repeat protein n=1 Tax=Streptomyces sp. NBC_01142 TaxID=2975865 RepID=UPI00224D08CD|nr:tetratricopeptide repeat protein [Streptomyces sp. NBC_01142]MCX4821002.1 tetratricopeptide repeat protein [Streptomyces sp. NBC_01142]